MEKTSTQAYCYIKNPDVVVAEEDSDGALIYNSDTDRIRALNHTGLFIWNLCDGDKDMTGIISAVKEAFKDVPKDQVSKQSEKFVDEMVAAGFIGTVEE